jgi:hypothetical protein
MSERKIIEALSAAVPRLGHRAHNAVMLDRVRRDMQTEKRWTRT